MTTRAHPVHARVRRALADIRAFCARHASRAEARRYARFFTEGYDPYGIDKATWEANAARFYDAFRERFTLADFLDLGDLLWQSGKYEEGSFAITTLRPLLDEFDAGTVERIGGWLEAGVRNWAHTDVICGTLVAPCLQRGVVGTGDLARWTASPGRWKRRAVPVSLLALLPDRARPAALLDVVRPLMSDPERVVHQGTGWFLREMWKAHPATVEAFLLEWKDTAPRLIFQYATEKMTPAGKARFRRQATTRPTSARAPRASGRRTSRPRRRSG
jgi:3-methyladenine DNA glycosylase AlkD